MKFQSIFESLITCGVPKSVPHSGHFKSRFAMSTIVCAVSSTFRNEICSGKGSCGLLNQLNRAKETSLSCIPSSPSLRHCHILTVDRCIIRLQPSLERLFLSIPLLIQGWLLQNPLFLCGLRPIWIHSVSIMGYQRLFFHSRDICRLAWQSICVRLVINRCFYTCSVCSFGRFNSETSDDADSDTFHAVMLLFCTLKLRWKYLITQFCYISIRADNNRCNADVFLHSIFIRSHGLFHANSRAERDVKHSWFCSPHVLSANSRFKCAMNLAPFT